MRQELTIEKIKSLAYLPNVQTVAVENFLATVKNNPHRVAAVENLKHDAQLYGWNEATVRAIHVGIDIVFGRA